MANSLRKTAAVILTMLMLVSIIPFQAFAAIKPGWHKEGKCWDGCYEYRYYITSTTYATGWKKIGGVWYYFDTSDGLMVRDRSDTGYEPGVVNDNGNFYYFAKNGKMMSSKWVETGYGWTYLTSSGAAVVEKGWRKISKKWYYFCNNASKYGPSTILMYNHLLKYHGDTYLFDNSGKMYTGGWFNHKRGSLYQYDDATDRNYSAYTFTSSYSGPGTWRYFKSSGIAVTGWKKISGKWYYFDKYSCIMYSNRSLDENGYRYYFDSNGKCTNPNGQKIK